MTTNVMDSDLESNVSSFVHYNDKNAKYLYISTVANMALINQELLQIERNMKNIVKQSGPLESQLNILLQSLPRPDVSLSMETD